MIKLIAVSAEEFLMLIILAFALSAMLLNPFAGLRAKSGQAVQQASSQAAQGLRINQGDLKKLKWIEGTWRGTGDVEKPFYERYYFENENTLAVESFEDESLSKVSDVTRFELSDGRFGNGGEGARWVATALTEGSITFEPVARARNSFLWQRVSDDSWKAVLKWPATATAPARERVYKMERWQAPKR
jgi:hypothetical protein